MKLFTNIVPGQTAIWVPNNEILYIERKSIIFAALLKLDFGVAGQWTTTYLHLPFNIEESTLTFSSVTMLRSAVGMTHVLR